VDIQLFQAIGIVQAGAADGGARQKNRLQLRHRRDGSGAAYAGHDGANAGGDFLGRVFEGNGPAGEFLRKAGLLLQPQGVELHYHTVTGIGKLGLPPPLVELDHLLEAPAHLGQRIDGQSQVF
jgi:hypothetical protein